MASIGSSVANIDKAIELNPENFFAFTNKGLALMEIGKLEDAKFNFNVSMKNSNKEPSWLSKAEIMKISGENEKALHCYDKVLESKPNNINALFYKGLLLETLGNYKDALKYINQVLEINSDHHQATEAKKRVLKKS